MEKKLIYTGKTKDVFALENGNYTVHANFNGTLFLKESHDNWAFAVDDGYSSYY